MTEKQLDSDAQARISYFDENYGRVLEKIDAAARKSGRRAEDIRLLAATKTVPVEAVNYAISKGISLIGENRVQELLSKIDRLDTSAERHFIGHLQTNKVKQIIGRVSMIESVDSVSLAKVISEQSVRHGLTTDILIEVNIGAEESKSGFSPDGFEEKIAEIACFDGVFVRGLMAIPPICEQNDKKCYYFEQMQKLFIDISGKKIDNVNMDCLSMGMSGDYEEAILCGANIIRLGSTLFGARNYNMGV